MSKILKTINPISNDFGMIGYEIAKTTSKNGAVARGECKVNQQSFLLDIVEQLNIFDIDNKIIIKNENETRELNPKTLVSMNFWGFTPQIFKHLETQFIDFLKENSTSKTAEFYIPKAVNELLKLKKCTVKVHQTSAQWIGVTYADDKFEVIKKLSFFKAQQVYPKFLWQ